MRILGEIAEWILAVIRAWYGWVGASATAGFIGLGQSLDWWHAGKRSYLWLMATGFILSMFQAWVKEHRTAKAYSDSNARPLSVRVHQCLYESHGIGEIPDGLNSYDVMMQVELESWAVPDLKLAECLLQYTNIGAVQKTVPAVRLKEWITWDGNARVPLPDLSDYLVDAKRLSPNIPVEGWFGFTLSGVPYRYPNELRLTIIVKDDKGRAFTPISPLEGGINTTAAQAKIARRSAWVLTPFYARSGNHRVELKTLKIGVL